MGIEGSVDSNNCHCLYPILNYIAFIHSFGEVDGRNRKQCDDAVDGTYLDGYCGRMFRRVN